MQKRTVVVAIGLGLGLMTLLFLLSYASSGQGAFVGTGRVVAVALIGYLALRGRALASFLLALWFGFTGLAVILGAVALGSASQIVLALVLASGFFWSAVVMWRTRKHGITTPRSALISGKVAEGGSSG